MKKCLINVDGGLGKHVMFTAILKEFKEKKSYDEIYVISSYFDVFKSCSVVTDAFPPMQGTLYQELVLDSDCDIYWKEPYSNQRFIKKECHLFDAWAEELGFKLSKQADEYVPNIDKIEEEFPNVLFLVEDKIKELNDDFIIVQFNGGQSPLSPMVDEKGNQVPYNDKQESIKRNYFKGQEIINSLKDKYPNTTIVHFALPNEPTYENSIKLQLPYLAYRLLAKNAKAVISTDSALQHLSTGVNNNVTVIWGETRPEHFGYKVNQNIAATKVLNSQPYFKPLGISPSIVKMPNPDIIVASVIDKINNCA